MRLVSQTEVDRLLVADGLAHEARVNDEGVAVDVLLLADDLEDVLGDRLRVDELKSGHTIRIVCAT